MGKALSGELSCKGTGLVQYFLCISMVQTQDPPGAVPLWTLRSSFEQLERKDHMTMLHTKFQVSEPSSSGGVLIYCSQKK